ncbi:hypothetical protein YB2330_005261 [Saitoella coloradoensis]
MWLIRFAACIVLLVLNSLRLEALRYDPDQALYNLNQNETAVDPLDYWGQWSDHEYYPSPKNWRMPFYTLFLDRFVNGDPSNDDINGTAFEHDLMSTQFRNGGDLAGLVNTLDYLQGMGIEGLYLAGGPFINQPWSADSYGPLDFTLLDGHHGELTEWRIAITEIHRRGMYVILENTMSTMGDLMGFSGYLNESTPLSYTEHDAIYKTSRRYHDFDIDNDYLDDCDVAFPRSWYEDGTATGTNVTSLFAGCRKSDFDQYGDVSSFDKYPEWQKQISKFGFVQDRLREWRPSVLDKLKHFSCLMVAMLDIDGYRIDKALTITVDAQAEWSEYMRTCAKQFNKTNFFIPGEIVGGNTVGSIYIGRGKEPGMTIDSYDASFNTTNVVNTTNVTNSSLYIREDSRHAIDSAAFHYSVYRSLLRWLGIEGEYGALGDLPMNFVDGWQTILRTNDLVNANTGEFDPRHMFGASNQDVFRWPGISNGTEKNLLGLFITTLLLPGIPMVVWGEEQAFYTLDNTAANYLYNREPMTSTLAWELHGCYQLGSEAYPNFPLESALYGCEDNSLSLDRRDAAERWL